MSTATIVASAVGGSVSANLALTHSSIDARKKKKQNDNFSHSTHWIEYEALKGEIDGLKTIEEKLNHLRTYKCFIPMGVNTESFNLALDALIFDLEFQRELNYQEKKDNVSWFFGPV